MEWINSRAKSDKLHLSRRLKQEKDMFKPASSDLPVGTISLNHFLKPSKPKEELEVKDVSL